MCGIAGYQGTFPRQLMTSMSRLIEHRGPDGRGEKLFDFEGLAPTALIHRRLAIIDLSEDGLQPMGVDCDCCQAHGLSHLALTYNGEIYNYREIRQRLVAKGHVFRSASDSEVLIHLYAEKGLGMFEELNGIFAFAIRDGRHDGRPDGVERGDVLVARDHFGVKPLYWAQVEKGVLFASELKAILQCRDVARDLDAVALAHTLGFLWSPAPRTALKGVRKLAPGHAMVLHDARVVREWQFVEPPPPAQAEGDERALIVATRETFMAAVKRQMVSDVPVGFFLSGGLDSTSIVAAALRGDTSLDPRCYCIGFAGDVGVEDNPDDAPFARSAAAALGVNLTSIVVQPDMIRNLDRMIWFLDEPQADPAPINAMLISAQARADGIKVLMSGAGGDDLFAGYRRHLAVRAEKTWNWLPPTVRRAIGWTARRVASGRAPISQRRQLARRAVKMFSFADSQADRRISSYFLWSADELRAPLYGERMRDAFAPLDVLEPLLQTLGEIPDEGDSLARMLYLERRHFLGDHNLNYTDKMGMAHGVEIRVPFLDRELVKLADSIPGSLKQQGTTGKAILKKAMEPFIPSDIIRRRKSGFGVPLRRWLRTELAHRVDELLSDEALAQRGLFDPKGVRALVMADRGGRVDGSYTIFALMCIEIWCRQFVDSTPSQPPSLQ